MLIPSRSCIVPAFGVELAAGANPNRRRPCGQPGDAYAHGLSSGADMRT